jgi:hypothetical protein
MQTLVKDWLVDEHRFDALELVRSRFVTHEVLDRFAKFLFVENFVGTLNKLFDLRNIREWIRQECQIMRAIGLFSKLVALEDHGFFRFHLWINDGRDKEEVSATGPDGPASGTREVVSVEVDELVQVGFML